jgi:hypothetical protein
VRHWFRATEVDGGAVQARFAVQTACVAGTVLEVAGGVLEEGGIACKLPKSAVAVGAVENHGGEFVVI